MLFLIFFLFKQKTAYDFRFSDWSSDVCSSDLAFPPVRGAQARMSAGPLRPLPIGVFERAGGGVGVLADRKLLRRQRHAQAQGLVAEHARDRAEVGRATRLERMCKYG